MQRKKVSRHRIQKPIQWLWDLRANTNLTQQSMSNDMKNINYIIQKNKTKHDLAAYYRASLFSPAISTLTKAMKKVIL